jgi:hypothetical protein
MLHRRSLTAESQLKRDLPGQSRSRGEGVNGPNAKSKKLGDYIDSKVSQVDLFAMQLYRENWNCQL